ncbi:MFS transporter [Bordetella pertussis]|uniref:MFS transporter n=1 Tax=Bordetella pertussis TaxID=520 RepID=UPI001F03D9B1|nr:MFS transporter [Bordetella pertussis]ULY53080.1 MFS transporter [Bordetella pertussis]ULY70746.1 MFS transporter [Bordetella pertussis]ULY84608.1 MFS transporter [Bordetella pertussis]ULY87982.1 MFS transporter [Bordetella pertussis]ULY97479.1 MFS transporter [Bordetella pertussis]
MSTSEKPSLRILFIGTGVVLLAMGVRATFGLFMQPMDLAHGWGREVFSMAFALQNLVWGAACIGMGILADRYGSGRTIVLGAVLYALGMIGTRFATDEATLYLTAGVLVGLGQAGTTFPVILSVVARSVPAAYRSTAMGIASAGGSLGQFLVVPAGQQLITGLDWPGALWVLSLLVAVGAPLAYFLRGKPGVHGGVQQSLGAAVRQAMAHPSFHFLSWSYFVCGFHTAFITLHLPAYVVDAGMKASHGATAIALIGLCNVIGSFYAGKLGGVYSKRLLLAAIYGLRAFGMLLLLAVPLTPLVLYVFAGWMGLFWLGTVPLTQGLIGQIYGLRYAATLSGIAFLGHQVGSFIGVWMGGAVYARTGNYDLVWWTGVALAVVAALLCLPVREQPLAQPAAARA